MLAVLVELAGQGTIADLGCGPGHVTRFLAGRHPDVIGIDLSPGMVTIARRRAPELTFIEASLLELPVPDAAWAAAIAFYSIIHLSADERRRACQELARVVRPGGWVLVAFHVDSDTFAAGDVNHLRHWFGQDVELDGHFLDPLTVVDDLQVAGFDVNASIERQPYGGLE